MVLGYLVVERAIGKLAWHAYGLEKDWAWVRVCGGWEDMRVGLRSSGLRWDVYRSYSNW